MVAAYRDPVMRQWLRHLVTTAGEARAIIQAGRTNWAAGTCLGQRRDRTAKLVPGWLV
jgi:hypothetical protein